MANELKILRDYVRKNGLKGTQQREAVLAHLLSAKKHLSPEEIHESMRSRGVNLGRATVFRTLKLLENCGLAARVTFADGRQRFERKHGRPHHDHMICVGCGEAIEFSSPAIERLQDQAAKRHNFRIEWHRHELFGRCGACAGRG